MARLIVRTAIANLRSRPLQTGLVALILAAASATLALAVSLRAGAADPYEQIARATNAADVHVLVAPRCAGRPRGPGPCPRASAPPTAVYEVVGVSVRSRPSNLDLALEGVGADSRASIAPR